MNRKTPSSTPPENVLVIDDEVNMRHMLSVLLSEAGYAVDTAEDGSAALQQVSETSYTYILCDIKMPKMDGLAFLKAASDHIRQSNVIMMSAYGTIDTAVEAMKLGAYDYISKPFKPDEVLLTLKKAEERTHLKTENVLLKQRIQEIGETQSFGNMVAASQKMQSIFKLTAKVAQYDTIVLITGESGTGKELIARGIHFSGKRFEKPFIPINCAGIPENLLESELFGYKKGSFTGADHDHRGLIEAASGGTLFLDEIGDLPLALQVKLLRVLQDSEVRPVGSSGSKKIDVRVIAATAKDLDMEVREGRFREDLFYRLNVMRIHLPALVERIEDIPLLCDFFIKRYGEKFDKKITGISASAMKLLLKHTWPGNVRELENLIERAVILSDEEILLPEHFPTDLGHGENGVTDSLESALSGYSLKEGKAALEKILIKRALAATEGNRTQAAKLLEISHPSLLSKIRTYGIG